MKKGFTLIELMAVIIILSLFAILTFPNIVGQIKKTKNEKNNNVNTIVLSATKKYINDNPNEYDKEEGNNYCIAIKDLVDNDYLKEDIVNTEDNNLLDFVVNVSYEEEFKYEIASKCSNYTELKYIESTGTQYIDTDFYPNQDTSIEFVAETTDIESTLAWYGGRNYLTGTAQSEKAMSYALWQVGKSLRLDYEESTFNTSDIDNDQIISVYRDKNKVYLNDNLVNEFSYLQFTSPSTLTLFGVKTYLGSEYNGIDSVDNRMAKLRLYSCKIWDNDKLIRNYIPVLDKNSVACLYDKVEKKYYYNQGTGDFLYQQ